MSYHKSPTENLNLLAARAMEDWGGPAGNPGELLAPGQPLPPEAYAQAQSTETPDPSVYIGPTLPTLIQRHNDGLRFRQNYTDTQMLASIAAHAARRSAEQTPAQRVLRFAQKIGNIIGDHWRAVGDI